MSCAFRRLAAVAALLCLADVAWAKERAAAASRQSARSELTAAGVGWTKVCFDEPQGRRPICYTTRDFAEEGGTPIVSLEVFETKSEEPPQLRMFVPLGLALKPGIRVGLERGEQESGAFDICFPAGCYASAKVPATFVDAMRRGGKLILSVKRLSGEELDFSLPLDGFGKAFDGPGAAPEEIDAEHRKRLQDELAGKAAAERQKLSPPSPGDATTPQSR